jgi:hypothetical protein
MPRFIWTNPRHLSPTRRGFSEDIGFMETMKQEEQYIKIDRDGNKFYFKNKAMTLYHRLNGPAVEAADGCKEWWVDGNCHRLDGPSVEYADGSKAWYVNGKRHRLDGPALEYANGYKAWWVDGKRHRLDGPAIELTNGCKAWYVDNKRHRLDGPAIEGVDGCKEWWVDGKHLSEEEFNTLTKPLEPLETMSDTPETLVAWGAFKKEDTILELLKHAIRIERERDEAREQLSIALAEIDRSDVAGIHSCHSECERTNCVLRRELTTITEQRDNCQIEIQIVIERLKGNRHPDDNGMRYEGEIDVKSIIAQRDRLAVALERILEYKGRFAEEDPESIASEALQSLTTTKQ